MMLILLCFKCYWFVSCMCISKASWPVSARSSSQDLCIFPIVISSLAQLQHLESSQVHSIGHITEFCTVLLFFLLFHYCRCKLLVLTSKTLHNSIPYHTHTSSGICYPSTHLSLLTAASISASWFYISLYDWEQKPTEEPVKSLCSLLYNVSVMYHIALKHRLTTAR